MGTGVIFIQGGFLLGGSGASGDRVTWSGIIFFFLVTGSRHMAWFATVEAEFVLLDTRSAKVVGVGETPSNFWCIPLFKLHLNAKILVSSLAPEWVAKVDHSWYQSLNQRAPCFKSNIFCWARSVVMTGIKCLSKAVLKSAHEPKSGGVWLRAAF